MNRKIMLKEKRNEKSYDDDFSEEVLTQQVLFNALGGFEVDRRLHDELFEHDSSNPMYETDNLNTHSQRISAVFSPFRIFRSLYIVDFNKKITVRYFRIINQYICNRF